MPAMVFVMASFYFLLKGINDSSIAFSSIKNFIFSGIMMGVAIGFRITSGAMLIPFCLLLLNRSKESVKVIFVVSIATTAIGPLTYIPVIKNYGFSFFTFSDQFPYPNLPKVIYKATFGVFGTIGIAVLLFYKIKIFAQKTSLKEKLFASEISNKLFLICMVTIVIYFISYLRLPQKSAYLIPIIPFVIMLFGNILSAKSFKVFCVLLTLSSFFFSINLTNPLRGASYSPFAMKFHIAKQELFIDPLTGPVFSDYTKRLNKITFTDEVCFKTKIEPRKIVLICGWWYNELRVRNWNCEENQNVKFVYYMEKQDMEKYISDGYEIFYLPEQNIYNDQYSRMNYTDSVSKPYM